MIVRAAVQQPCGGTARAAISNMRLVFCLDISGSMEGGLSNVPHASDMVYRVARAGIPMEYGGVMFANAIVSTQSMTSDPEVFMESLYTGSPNLDGGPYEAALEALLTARTIMRDVSTEPGGYIALSTDHPSQTPPDKDDVISELAAGGYQLYVDPTDGCTAYYQDFYANHIFGHVLGAVENPLSLGTWTFPALNGILMP